MQKAVICAVAVLAIGAFIAGVSQAREVTVDVVRDDVTTHTPLDSDLGKYYTFTFPIPKRHVSETLMDAWLEMVVDAATRADTASGHSLATVQVYPLKATLTGDLSSSQLRAASMKRTVRLGESRRVRIDIREHLEYVLQTPTDDFGLVVGSVTGQRLARITLKHGVLGPGVVARLTVVYQSLE